MRLIRRSSIVGAAAAVISSCFPFGGTGYPAATTHTQAAEMSSTAPPLAAFVLRVAVAHLSLDDTEAVIGSDAARVSEAAIAPIDIARNVLVGELIREVEQHRVGTDGTAAAAAHVVKATDDAAPEIDQALTTLYESLDPWERIALDREVNTRFAGWSVSWDGGKSTDHAWLHSLATTELADRETIDVDAHETARHWAEGLVHEVEAKAPATFDDDAARAALVAGLRTQGHH